VEKRGNEVTIKKMSQMGGTALMKTALVAYMEGVRDGFMPGRWSLVGWDSEAHYAVNPEGEAIGLLAFRVDNGSEAFITFGWTREDHRRQGVYAALFESVCEDLRGRGQVQRIIGSIHPGNTAALRAAAQMGRTAVSVTYEMELQA
jgi:RimJ/RimL family protein N-acetyltransferase